MQVGTRLFGVGEPEGVPAHGLRTRHVPGVSSKNTVPAGVKSEPLLG